MRACVRVRAFVAICSVFVSRMRMRWKCAYLPLRDGYACACAHGVYACVWCACAPEIINLFKASELGTLPFDAISTVWCFVQAVRLMVFV